MAQNVHTLARGVYGTLSSGPAEILTADIVEILWREVQKQLDGLTSRAVEGRVVVKTWALLSGLTPDMEFQGAVVVGPDAGTHYDAVEDGAVDNMGLYTWNEAETRWERLADYPLISAEVQTAIDDAVTGLVAADIGDTSVVGRQLMNVLNVAAARTLLDVMTTAQVTAAVTAGITAVKASSGDATTGTSNDVLSSPLRVGQQIDARRASAGEAQTGTDASKLMTPLRATDHFHQRTTTYTRALLEAASAAAARTSLGAATASDITAAISGIVAATIGDSTATGRAVLKAVDAAAARAAIGALSSAEITTIANARAGVAVGALEPGDIGAATPADIAAAIAALDADDISNASAVGKSVLTAATAATARTAISAASTSDLAGAIAGLVATSITDSTTMGRSLLTAANAAAVRSTIGAAAASDITSAISAIVATTISDSTSTGRAIIKAADAAAVRSLLDVVTSGQLSAAVSGIVASTISDSTAIGRAVMKAADAAAARAAIGAASTDLATGASNGLMQAADKAKVDSLQTVATSGAYADLTGKPALGSAAAANVDAFAAAPQFAQIVAGDNGLVGLAPVRYSGTLTGKGQALPPLAIGAPSTSDEWGTGWALPHADFAGDFFDLVLRGDFLLRPGRVWEFRIVFDRPVDASDPDAVEVRWQNLSKLHNHVSNVPQESFTPVGGGPVIEAVYRVGKAPPVGVELDYEVVAETAIYIRPDLRIHGGGSLAVTRVLEFEARDVTEIASLESRVGGVETLSVFGLSADPPFAEAGTTALPEITWTIRGSAEVASLTINGGALALDAESFTPAVPISSNTSYTVQVTGVEDGISDSSTVTFQFRPPVYYGASALESLPNSAAVLAELTKDPVLATGVPRSYQFALAAEYPYIAYPLSVGDHTLATYNDFVIEGTVSSVITMTTEAGHAAQYRVVRWPNAVTTSNAKIGIS